MRLEGKEGAATCSGVSIEPSRPRRSRFERKRGGAFFSPSCRAEKIMYMYAVARGVFAARLQFPPQRHRLSNVRRRKKCLTPQLLKKPTVVIWESLSLAVRAAYRTTQVCLDEVGSVPHNDTAPVSLSTSSCNGRRNHFASINFERQTQPPMFGPLLAT